MEIPPGSEVARSADGDMLGPRVLVYEAESVLPSAKASMILSSIGPEGH